MRELDRFGVTVMYLKYAKQCCSTLKEGKKVRQTMSKALTRKWKRRRAIELRKGIIIRKKRKEN